MGSNRVCLEKIECPEISMSCVGAQLGCGGCVEGGRRSGCTGYAPFLLRERGQCARSNSLGETLSSGWIDSETENRFSTIEVGK